MTEQKTVRLLDDKANLYLDPKITSEPAVVLIRDQEMSVGKVLVVDGVTWCHITLPEGETGYIAGTTKVKTVVPVSQASATPRRLVALAFLVLGAVVILWVFALIGALAWDYISAQRSDDLSKVGGRNRVYDWLAKDGLMNTLVEGKATPFAACAPIAGRQTSGPFVVWVFGENYREYSDTGVGSGALGWGGDAGTWGRTNAVLIVKLTGAGNETRPVSQRTQNSTAFPEIGPYKDEQVKVYDAEAWLIDKQTRQCLGHKAFPPGAEPDSAAVSSPVGNPFVKYYNVKDLRFRAVTHAVEWAKSLR
jgi:hypothetical protein